LKLLFSTVYVVVVFFERLVFPFYILNNDMGTEALRLRP